MTNFKVRRQKFGRLDLRETSSKLESSREDSKLLLSDGRVSKDTMTTEKGVMGVPGDTRLTGILRKSSIGSLIFLILFGAIFTAAGVFATLFISLKTLPPKRG